MAVAAFHKNDPAPIRRDLGEVVAHTVARSASNGFGHAAPSLVERNPVQVVLDLGLVRIVGVQRLLLACRIWVLRFGPGKDDVLAVGTPDSIRLNIAGIVGAGQRLALARGPVVPFQNAPSRIKDLEKAIVLEVGDVIGVGNVESRAGKGAHDVTPIRGDLGHESHANLSRLAVGIPLHNILALNGNMAFDRDNRIEPLVVGRPIDVDAHRLAVAGKRMAVGAGGHILQERAALRLANIPQTPTNQMNCSGRQRLHRPVCALTRHQRHIPVKDRRTHRIVRSGQRYARLRGGAVRAVIAGNRHCGRLACGARLNRRPGGCVGSPRPGSRLLGRQLWRFIGIAHALRIDGPDAHPFSRGLNMNGSGAIRERKLDLPGAGCRIAPEKGGRRNAGRKDGAIQGIVDGDGPQGGIGGSVAGGILAL